MVTRIRIEVAGACVNDCEESVAKVRTVLEAELPALNWGPGHELYERATSEPQGSRHAYTGRVVVHADVSEAAQAR